MSARCGGSWVAKRLALAGLAVAVTVTAASAAPTAQLTPASVSFPHVMVGTSSYETYINIQSVGSDVLYIKSIGLAGANPADFVQVRMCPSLRLLPGQACAVQVSFTPTAAGPRSATLSVESNSPGSPDTAALSGIGDPVSPLLAISPASLSFPDQAVGTPGADQTVTLTNPGRANLHIQTIALAGANPGDFVKTTDCDGQTVGWGQVNVCYFGVHFAPTADGNRSGTVVITSDAPGSPHLLNLAGKGVKGLVSLSAAAINFGTTVVGGTLHRQLTITNGAAAPLTVQGASLSSGQPGDFKVVPNCAQTLYSGNSCVLDLSFRPLSLGSRATSLTITSNASNPSVVVPLSGFGDLPTNLLPTPKTDDHSFVQVAPALPGNVCRVRSQGPIDVNVGVSRVVGAVGATGALLTAGAAVTSGVLSPTATLEVLAYNVSSTGSSTDPTHQVSLNGQVVGPLSGSAGQWSVTSFTVPITTLRYPALPLSGPPVPRANVVEVLVDTTHTDDGWCTSVAWAHLSFKALSPVVMIHGNGSNGGFFTRRGFAGALAAAGVVTDNSINLAPSSGGSATIANNMLSLQTQLPSVVQRFGVDSVHVVAHSKGGLDMRAWLGTFGNANPFRVLSLTTLSTPHNGSALADAAEAVRATGLGVPGVSLVNLSFISFGAGIPNLTTSFTAGFNPPLPTGADYRTLAGDTDTDGNGFITGGELPGIPDEYAAARAEGGLNTLFATNPLAVDALVTATYQFMHNVSSVTTVTIPVGIPVFPFIITVTLPLPLPGGGPNDLLVNVFSAHPGRAPFTGVATFSGAAGRDHASMANAASAATVLPFLITTDTTRGDLK